MTRFSKGQTRKKNKHDKRMCTINGDDDERFLDLSSNMFREQKRKENKVIVDDRFKQMLSDKRFEERDFNVDKRGKPIKKHADNFLTHLYELDKGEEESELSNDDTADAENGIGQNNEELPDESDSELKTTGDIPIQLDLARGEAPALFSSSSEDEDDNAYFDGNDDKEETDTISDAEKDIRHVEWASSRLAICNMDWNKLDAEDLFIVLNSFKPPNGIIYTVSVYLSDFGAERLEDEKKSGPKLKLKSSKKGIKDIEERTKQAIRNYESERLRYYYAVCECDSMETATAIYEACDGVEYGASGIRFDLRFVPNETQFEEKRLQSRITPDELNPIKYKPKRTVTHSLQLSNPKISWEEKDIERKFKMKQAFEKEAKLDEFESFLAPGSDEDNDEEQKNRYEILINAVKEAAETGENTKEEIEEEKTKEQNYEINFNNDEEKTIIDASDSEDEEQKPAKKKTKFQIYLERKKQLKIERKQKGLEKKRTLKRKKTKQLEGLDEKEKTQSTIVEQMEHDERFDAFFTDSAYQIDRTHSQYKGGNLAITQVYGKKTRNEKEKIMINQKGHKETEDHAAHAETSEMLINRLIVKQKRRQNEDI